MGLPEEDRQRTTVAERLLGPDRRRPIDVIADVGRQVTPPTTQPSRPSGEGIDLSAGAGPVRTRAENSAALRDAFGRSGSNPIAVAVSRYGVDPRSPEGVEIGQILQQFGMNAADPMVKAAIDDLVAQYQATLIGPLGRARNEMGPYAPGTSSVTNPYGYTADSAFRELERLSTEDLARVQDRLAALGLLSEVVPGRKTPATIAAFEELLVMANAEGQNWTRALSDLERTQIESGGDPLFGGSGSGRGGKDPFVAPAYIAPDYATLAQQVKDSMRRQLRRDPDDGEMALLTAELEGWYKGEYDAGVSAARMQYDDQTGTVQDVDPVARFAEAFEKKYEHEIDFVEDKDDAQVSRAVVDSASNTISRMSGGGQ